MSKTIKVIDLLNKIANGEEVPKKIKYKKNIYTYQYKEPKEENIINYYYCDTAFHHLIDGGYHDIRLNDEVEIIVDEQEIDIQSIDKIGDYRTSDDDLYNDNFEDFKGAINELVKAVKQLDKKIKED